MRPVRADTDSTLVESSVSGIAISSASAMPAVAIATVRQHSRSTRRRNSPSIFGGKKSAMKRRVDLSASGSNRIHGLNSVATSAGAISTSAASAQNTRPLQAGSRRWGEESTADMGPRRPD